MTIVRTAKGTVSDKSSALSITVSSVQVLKEAQLLVAVGYDTGEGDPQMTWGNRVINPRFVEADLGIRLALFLIVNNNNTATNDIVVDWDTTAPTAKVMLCTQITGVRRREFLQSNSGTGGIQGSGALVATGFVEEYLCGLFVSEGPSGDDAGTPSLSYTSGQRIGTTGGSADSNITLHETYKITTATEDTRARKTGATSRDWVVLVTGLKPVYDVSIDARMELSCVEAASQAVADASIEDDIETRYPSNYTVTIL